MKLLQDQRFRVPRGGALLAARLFLAAAIVLAPVRYRLLLVERPVPGVPADYTDLLLYASDAAVLLMLVAWLVSWLLSPRRLKLGPRSVWLPMTLVTLAGWASIISSYDPVLSTYHAIRLSVLLWFYFIVVNEIHSVGWLLIPVGVQISCEALVALAQFITQGSVHLQVIGEAYLDPARNGISIVTVNGLRVLRAYGLSDHPNILGGCLAFGMLLVLPVYLCGWKSRLAFSALLAGAIALLVTFSRAAWLAFALGCVVLLIGATALRQGAVLRRWLWFGLASFAMALPILLTYSRFFGVRLNAGNSFSTPTVEQQSLGERLLLVDSSVSIVKDHPLLGIGLGAAPLALRAYRPDWTLAFEPPHSAWLDAAVEIGLPGAVCYIILMLAPFVIYFGRRREYPMAPLAAATIAALLAVLVAGTFDYYTWMLSPGRLWQWLLWGLWALVSTPGSLKPVRWAGRAVSALSA